MNLSNRKSRTPIYLSRTRFEKSTTTIVNEDRLEMIVAETYGAKVVYPDKLTLRRAIQLFNEHSVFIGVAGSAFHNLLLRRATAKVTAIYLTMREESYRSYTEIDNLLGVDGHYVPCCSPTRIPREFECDVEMAQAAIASVLADTSEPVKAVAAHA